jgi:predicted DNA-binding protein (MmcQ/YjbR family)
MPKSKAARRAQATLRALALAYPGATEDFPWGETVVKVNKKVFVFLGRDEGEEWGLSVKLPSSREVALLLPFAQPTGYGLGKSGWVSASFGPKDEPPIEMLREWLDESYRAVAPKKLVASLDGAPPAKVRRPAAKKKPAPKQKPKQKPRR